VGGGLATASLSALLLLATPVDPPPREQATVCHGVRVIDGDTFRCTRPEGLPAYRLYGVDAPEADQPYGVSARAQLGRLLLGPLRITPVGTDRSQRVIARVGTPVCDDVSQRLVEAGLAWWEPQYAPDAFALRRAEDRARSARLGLWAAASYVSPRQWRARSSRLPRKDSSDADTASRFDHAGDASPDTY
jgi:micrococcal nuclease